MKKRTWYKLDNAAKIYPPTTSARRSGVFWLSAQLSQEVDAQVLNQAVEIVLNRFPSFKVKLKRGIFWYYLEENKKPFHVQPQPPYFLEYIKERETNDYLFKVFYLNNTISVTIYHVLTDGTGGMEFLKALVFEYLLLKGMDIKAETELKTIYSPPTLNESKDNFLHVYNKNTPKPVKENDAFKLNGSPFANVGAGVIIGQVKTEQLKTLAKRYNTTITSFLCGLVLFIIYENYIKFGNVKNKNVRILIPVNLRKFYKTSTIRNFALFTRPGYNFENELTLEECINLCTDQIKQGSQKEVLDTILASNVKAEKNVFLKIAPLFIKDIAMKIAYTKVGDNLHTTTISNLGEIKLPSSVTPFVKNFQFVLGESFITKHSISVCSYNDMLNIAFSRGFVETNIEKDFFKFLTQNGVEVTLDSNYWEDMN